MYGIRRGACKLNTSFSSEADQSLNESFNEIWEAHVQVWLVFIYEAKKHCHRKLATTAFSNIANVSHLPTQHANVIYDKLGACGDESQSIPV